MSTDTSTLRLTHPHLQWLLDDAREVTANIEHLRTHYSDEQLCWSPDENTWSVAAGIDHLHVMGEAYFDRIRTAIRDSAPSPEERTFDPSFQGRSFIHFVSPESRFKIPTTETFEPKSGAEASVLDRFLEQQDELYDLLREADEVDINDAKLTSPAMRLARFTVGEALTIIVAHERRHLQQALTLTRHADFPSA